jgi:hypothetical protein
MRRGLLATSRLYRGKWVDLFSRAVHAGDFEFVQKLSGAIVADFAVQKALDDLRQSFLYRFWIVQCDAFEPTLAGALGDSFGVALVLALMKIAKALPVAGRALAAGAILMRVLALECVGDGHRILCFLGLGDAPPPPTFANYSESAASRVFACNIPRVKDLGLVRMENPHKAAACTLNPFRGLLMMDEVVGEAQGQMSHDGCGKLVLVAFRNPALPKRQVCRSATA